MIIVASLFVTIDGRRLLIYSFILFLAMRLLRAGELLPSNAGDGSSEFTVTSNTAVCSALFLFLPADYFGRMILIQRCSLMRSLWGNVRKASVFCFFFCLRPLCRQCLHFDQECLPLPECVTTLASNIFPSPDSPQKRGAHVIGIFFFLERWLFCAC